MLTIERLLWPDTDLTTWRDAARGHVLGRADPLAEDDVLTETQLIDVRIDAMRSRAGLLFYLAGGLAFEDSDDDVGVLVASGVHTVSWSVDPEPMLRTAWTVMGSRPERDRHGVTLRLGFNPHADLVVGASGAAFVTGTSALAFDAPPDYTEDDEATVRAGLPSWSTAIEPSAAVVHTGPAG